MSTNKKKSKLAGVEPRGRPRCAVSRFMLEHPEEAEALQEMMDAPQTVWGNRALAQTVTEVTGFRLGHDSVGRHRRNDCLCNR